MFSSVRTRLTVWYIGVLALVLVAFSVGVYVTLTRALYAQLNYDLQETAKSTSASLVRMVASGKDLKAAAVDELNDHIGPDQSAAIFDQTGQVIAENPDLAGVRVQLPNMDPSQSNYPSNLAESSGRRMALKRFAIGSPEQTCFIVITQPVDQVLATLHTVRLILFFGTGAGVILAALGGSFLARRSLQPVARMTEQARRMSAENLEQRLPVTDARDELGNLAATFNELLGRLDESLTHQRRFMADASHELRTPLSVMRTAISVTLDHERAAEEYRDALTLIDEQARRLTRIVADMFTLARADTEKRALMRTDFHLDRLIEECVRAAEILASRKGVRVTSHSVAETLYRGDEGLLRQLILNLLDNAIKHTPPIGHVSVALTTCDATHQITVQDSGAGIPREAQPHIFERFYRVDKARARGSASEFGTGAGLGLSIAQWIARQHGGEIKLAKSDPQGSIFVTTLPAINS
ncbi:MAG TPA: ATP-binding protein [Pyrinomonadaceae bacterium]|nr:ATP-binding protein [Pyrinomonadaceae bacterium]